jgi:hypothetical protein
LLYTLKEQPMSHLRVLICQVDECNDEQLTELARMDLPSPTPHTPSRLLDQLEASIATQGQQLLRWLYELQWEELDRQAVARYLQQAPGRVVADGYEPLTVASRFGTLRLRRRVCVQRETNRHVLPGNALLPAHQGMLITRGLAEWACLLPQDLPFASVARLLGWQTGEPGVLSATMVRTLVRDHGERIRRVEQAEVAAILLSEPVPIGQRLQVVPHGQPRRRAGWPPELATAVAVALEREQAHPPDGVSWADWERVLAARTAEAGLDLEALRMLGPELAPGQVLLMLDEILTPARQPGQFHELRTACLMTADGRRYLSGTGAAFLHQVLAAVLACFDHSLLVIADGARWIRTFYHTHLACLPNTRMVLDWHHLKQKCAEMASRFCAGRAARRHLLRRLYRQLWGGKVSRALGVLARYRPQARNLAALEELQTYLVARAEWIPDYRAQRRSRQYIGSGQVEHANDCIVARRQKCRGMQWSARTSAALAALRTLQLNEGWDAYWVQRQALPLTVAA